KRDGILVSRISSGTEARDVSLGELSEGRPWAAHSHEGTGLVTREARDHGRSPNQAGLAGSVWWRGRAAVRASSGAGRTALGARVMFHVEQSHNTEIFSCCANTQVV